MNSKTQDLQEYVKGLGQTRPYLDVKTFLIILLFWSGPAILFFLVYIHTWPLWAASLVGILVMNLSFTSWHEAAHGNLSSQKWINHTVGIISSYFALWPGYFAAKREHLIHHRFEGSKDLDPVWPRIQAGPFSFLLRLLTTFRANLDHQSLINLYPRSSWQVAADMMVRVLVVITMGVAIYYGQFWNLLGIWILPRIFVFFIHAYYICYFPHAIEGGGFRLYRAYKGRPFFRFLTVEQSLHGIHHKWVHIPWHKYNQVLKFCIDNKVPSDLEVK